MITSELILGVETDALHLHGPAKSKFNRPRKSLCVFFIAGNPGTLHFYKAFLERLLIEALTSHKFADYDSISCHGVGHANHHLEGSSASSTRKSLTEESECYNLEFQVQHKLSFVSVTLDDLASCNIGDSTEIDVMMVGHSIGAYIAIDILARNQQLMSLTKSVILLMPFISWSQLPYLHRAKLTSYVRLLPLSRKLITSLASPLVRMGLPMRKLLLCRLTGMEGDIVDMIADALINKRLLNNFLEMGRDEITDVKKNEQRILSILEDMDERFVTDKKEIMFIYTDDDVWAPESDAIMLQKRMPKSTTVVIERGLTHGFSLTDSRVNRTCSIIIDNLKSNNLQKNAMPEEYKYAPTNLRRISKL